ncbi:MICAL C-terminal-like protein [Iris pallida]|uniref:MICAL C-terminal-like protein n=1 Tax=Iris pallida TaxID=29817 RepID=A0AAX6E4V3_IRIPA|nr:MICAL C-terminal-like protein [Iris pallida]
MVRGTHRGESRRCPWGRRRRSVRGRRTVTRRMRRRSSGSGGGRGGCGGSLVYAGSTPARSRLVEVDRGVGVSSSWAEVRGGRRVRWRTHGADRRRRHGVLRPDLVRGGVRRASANESGRPLRPRRWRALAASTNTDAEEEKEVGFQSGRISPELGDENLGDVQKLGTGVALDSALVCG